MQVICKTTFSLFGIEPVGPISLNGYGQVGLLSCSLSLIGSVWRRWVEWLAQVVSGRWGSAVRCCARRERGDTCFPVAECRGWRQGCVGGGGSAGSVLRSQGSSG